MSAFPIFDGDIGVVLTLTNLGRRMSSLLTGFDSSSAADCDDISTKDVLHDAANDALHFLNASSSIATAVLADERAPLIATIAIVVMWTATVIAATFGAQKSVFNMDVLSIRTSWRELTTTAGSHLDVLDVFRVCAIVWVVANHLGSEGRIDILEGSPSAETFKSAIHNHPILGALLGNSALGVEIFLVLSGLLAARSWHRRAAMPFFSHTRQFLVRRVFRLLPTIAVFIFLAASPLMTFLLPRFHDTMVSNCGVRGLVTHLTMTGNWQSAPTCLGYLWYPSLDIQLYMLAPPLLFCLYRQPRIAAALIVALIAASTALRAVHCQQFGVCARADVDIAFVYRRGTSDAELSGDYTNLWNLYARPCTKAGPFLIGLVLGFITANVDAKFGAAKVRRVCTLGFVACIAIIYAILPQYWWPDAGNTLYNIIYMAVFRSAFALAIAAQLFALFYAAERPKVAALWGVAAKLTFSVYLCHMPVIYLFNYIDWYQTTTNAASLLALMPIACLASFGVGFIFYMLVEAPLSRLSALCINRLLKL